MNKFKTGMTVKSIENSYGLTFKKKYKILDADCDDLIYIANDYSEREWFLSYRFKLSRNSLSKHLLL